ncbi:hypothetical protein [Streptomyces varsoviensis]|uniref:Acetoacetate decarboxylase n=1 Tax=Streptomyces varsoviensis TaxID=67373 RepID=A0ABR5J811_9ACTN|nr:hypothetical protein [Streptomyces varsoviensis]KOG89569.1 hypothetical protein ADK38_13540 [Streptomyces varsoviensis]
MLIGTADPEALAADAPYVTSLATEPLVCRGVELLQAVYEVHSAARLDLLPPALHPVNPPAITLTVLTARESEAGPFALAETRIVCRSGVRSRGFQVSCFVQGAAAGRLLADRWGFKARAAEIEVRPRHLGTTAVVRCDGAPVLDLRMLHPQAISAADVQFTDSMQLARTAAGHRLVQVERAYSIETVERGRPSLRVFDGAALGEPRLRPTQPVSALALTGELTIRPVRYVCRADISAFEGTERVG